MFRFRGFTSCANDAVNLALSQACLLGHTDVYRRQEFNQSHPGQYHVTLPYIADDAIVNEAVEQMGK